MITNMQGNKNHSNEFSEIIKTSTYPSSAQILELPDENKVANVKKMFN